MTDTQQPQPPDAPVDYLYADQFGVHHVCEPHIAGAFPVYRHRMTAGAQVDAQSSFTVELTPEQEKAFSKWVRGVRTTPWQRSVARLAFLLNHTQRGLIDYAAAQHFASELASRAALENAPVADERAALRQAVTLLLQVHPLLGPCDHELRDRIGAFLGKGGDA